jgi:4-hydroxy-tetrahydrodipicolinate synthase
MVLEYTKSEAKAWAKKNFKGLEAPIFPSYSPDLSELDEDGIRWDVNHIIANGMISILIAPEATGMTQESVGDLFQLSMTKRRDESLPLSARCLDTVEENIDIMQHHEKTGEQWQCLAIRSCMSRNL